MQKAALGPLSVLLLLVGERGLRLLPPGGDQRLWQAQMIQQPGDHEVHQLADLLGLVVEARRGGHDGDAEAGEAQHVLEVDGGVRRLAGHEDQLAAFFEHHIGGALDEVVRGAVGNGGQGAHGAGADHHLPGRAGAGGDR